MTASTRASTKASTKASTRDAAPTVSRRPPLVGLLAAALGILGALVVGFAGVIAFGFSGGMLGVQGWLVVIVPLVLSLAVLVGVVLLVTGRSWLLLAWAGLLMTAAVVVAVLGDGQQDGDSSALVLFAGGPLLAALLAPGARTWIAARTRERAESDPATG